MAQVIKGRGQNMGIRPIPLSPEQASEFGVEGLEVRAMAYPDSSIGDGYITNGAHLDGNLVFMHKRRTKQGSQTRYSLTDAHSAILALRLTERSILEEADRIDGYQDTDGRRIEGEIDKIEKVRTDLQNWPNLTADDKHDDRKILREVAEPRTRATNPLNIHVGQQTAKLSGLKDSKGRENPGAVLAATLSVPDALSNRFVELISEDLRANAGRQRRVRAWFHQENQAVGAVSHILGQMIELQNPDQIYDLIAQGKNVRFLKQPLGQLARHYYANRYHIEDPGVLETARNGIEYHKQHNYLAQPFRIITAMTQSELTGAFQASSDELASMVAERQAALADIRPGGEYDSLVSQSLEPLAEQVILSIRNSDVKAAQLAAKQFRFLHTYHVLNKDDPRSEIWYRWKF